MGIDIYAEWKNQTKKEKEAQYSGFSIVAGNSGYLREAYHGGPYATKYLVSEAFDGGSAKIEASVLRERLPITIMLALYRDFKVYNSVPNDPRLKFEDLIGFMKKLPEIMADDNHEDMIKKHGAIMQEAGLNAIKSKTLPDFLLSFVQFVELCEIKEKDTGEPCTIIASY